MCLSTNSIKSEVFFPIFLFGWRFLILVPWVSAYDAHVQWLPNCWFNWRNLLSIVTIPMTHTFTRYNINISEFSVFFLSRIGPEPSIRIQRRLRNRWLDESQQQWFHLTFLDISSFLHWAKDKYARRYMILSIFYGPIGIFNLWKEENKRTTVRRDWSASSPIANTFSCFWFAQERRA